MAHNAGKLARFLIVGAVLLLAACGGLVNHKVQKGETLYSIGWRYGQDYRDIAKWNKLEPPYTIYEGQWLRVAPPVEPWWQDDYPERAKALAPSTPPPPRRTPDSPNAVAKPSAAAKAPQIPRVPSPVQAPLARDSWQWPVKSVRPDLIQRHQGPRKGINILGRAGEPIYAAASGKVVYRGSGLVGLGKLIIIKHDKTFLSAYAHNAEILVNEGDHVERGQRIARMGRTDAGQILLYFEIRKNGKPVNPLLYLPALREG